jgi:hypothetical protein
VAPTVLWYSSACAEFLISLKRHFLNHHLAPAVSYPTGEAGYLRWLLAGLVMLGAASLGVFGYSTRAASNPLTPLSWQFALVVTTWLISIAAVLHFLHQLPQGDVDFDGENWYFFDQTTKTEQVGTVSVRLDVQNGMLLRFESEFKRVSWLWLEAKFIAENSSQDWHDLRRAVYSRPAIQNSPDLI